MDNRTVISDGAGRGSGRQGLVQFLPATVSVQPAAAERTLHPHPRHDRPDAVLEERQVADPAWLGILHRRPPVCLVPGNTKLAVTAVGSSAHLR